MVLDPEGKIVFRGTDPKQGSHFYNVPGKPKVPYADLKKAMEQHNKRGLLQGVELPGKLVAVAAAIKQGQLAKAQTWLDKVSDKGATGAAKAELEKRLEELRGKKLALFESLLADEKHWDAYKAGASYVRCFPKAEDASQVKSKLRALKSKPDVKRNLDARNSFRRYAAACYGPRRQFKEPTQAQALFRKAAKKHEGTEYGDAAKAITE